MPATCPQCGTPIKPFAVRSHFACRFCAADLNGHILGPIIWAIAIWQLTDIFFFPLFQQLAGDTWLAFIFRTLVCTLIGLRLYIVLVNECDTVSIADHDHSHEGEAIVDSQRETA